MMVMGGIEQHVHAMFKVPNVFPSKQSSRNKIKPIIMFATLSEARTMCTFMKKDQAFTKVFSCGEIRDYKPRDLDKGEAGDEEAISIVALQHIPALTSIDPLFGHSEKNYKKILKSEIIPALNGSDTTLKVYVCDGRPVAFICYTIHNPKRWFESVYKWFVPEPIGPNAEIGYLAVHEEFQGNKIGEALVKKALEDCHNQSVNCIELSTTSERVESFYQKLGFEITRYPATRMGAFGWTKRLKPNPRIIFTEHVIQWICKHFKNT